MGQNFRLHGSPFTVIGVLKRKVQQSSYSGRDKDKIIIDENTGGQGIVPYLPLNELRKPATGGSN